jgi:hypothetical protein
MTRVNVLLKNGDIDGKPITWNVLQINGTLSGQENTLELKLNKTEAMLARILLASDENLKVETSGFPKGNVAVSKKIAVKRDDDILEEGF